MSEDSYYLLTCYLIWLATFWLLILKNKYNIKSIIIHISVIGTYSSILLYNLKYNSSGGAGLLWLIYLMLFIGIHVLVNLVSIIMRKNKASNSL